MANILRKCANAACNCVPPNKEKFCSAHCEGIGDKTEIVCTCGHEGCVLSTTTTREEPRAIVIPSD